MCASRALGVRETFVLRNPAGELQQIVAAVAGRLIELINQTKPDVLITWGPDGFTGHFRHIMVGGVVTRVFQQQGLLKHKPRKLYNIAFPEARFPDTRLPFSAKASDEAGPLGAVSEKFITTEVDGNRYMKQTRGAIACHTLPIRESDKVWRQEWHQRLETTLGGKVFLRLALPAPRGPETDIFKGL